MVDHFVGRSIICNHKTLETPLVPEQLGKKPMITCSGNSVNNVECCHCTTRSCIDSRFIRRKVVIKHCDPAHIHSVIITSGFCSPIKGKMFYTCHHSIVE